MSGRGTNNTIVANRQGSYSKPLPEVSNCGARKESDIRRVKVQLTGQDVIDGGFDWGEDSCVVVR